MSKINEDFIDPKNNIGITIARNGDTLSDMLNRYIDSDINLQFFLMSPISTKIDKLDEKEILDIKHIITKFKKKCFVHAPYVINICKKWNTNIDLINYHLKIGKIIGVSGIVIHVGKITKMDFNEAMNNMYETIKTCLNYATKECPLLLETPAGQGTETLTNMNDFINFILKFDTDKFGCCVDTCHVFASGYYPDIYLIEVLIRIPDKLKLIHFNGSKKEFNSYVDSHEYFSNSNNKIHRFIMNRCINLISMYNIPSVIE